MDHLKIAAGVAAALLLGGCVPDALRFEDYPAAPEPLAAPAETRIPASGLSWKMRQYLEVSGDTGEPDFAGHFRVFAIGCGTGCLQYRLIDRRTGEVLPGGEVSNGHIRHRRDSRLLIAQRTDGYGLPAYLDYWVWNGTRLHKVMTHEIRDFWTREEPAQGGGQPR